MIIKPTTIEELKEIWIEMFLNNTDEVTKISPLSSLNAISYGNAKIGQKLAKELALIETNIFPDQAYGQYLDKIALDRGVSSRFGESGSFTYLRIVGEVDTFYASDSVVFTGSHGIEFQLVEDFSIPDEGFGYAKVRSLTQGEKTNVEALSINKVNPKPIGHLYVINEYKANGGRNSESDDDFRNRIKENANVFARGTISMLEQIFNKINNDVLKCYYGGINSDGQTVVKILTQNGIDLSESELNEILLKGKDFLSLTDLKPDNVNGYGVKLENVEWFPVDISTRLILEESVNANDVRKEIQLRLGKYFDYRTFDKQKVEWDDLLGIVKNTPGVKYVLDNFFSPGVDLSIPKEQLPRIRGFLMLNPDGSLITSGTNTLNPFFYPDNSDFSYQQTVFKNLD